MNDSDSIDVSSIQFVQSDDVFWIMVFDFHQVIDFPIRVVRKLDTDLYIEFFIPFRGDKVDFFCVVLSDIDIIFSSFQFKKDDIL